jgi:hypothetical protein
MKRLSVFLYKTSNWFTVLLSMAIMALYAQFIMGGQAAEYNSSFPEGMKVPDLMFGYDQSYILNFMQIMGEVHLRKYLDVVIIWDTLFPVIYTLMNLLIFSFLFKDLTKNNFYWINLLPLLSIPLDLIENTFEVLIVNDYLDHGAINSSLVSYGSLANMIKWSYTYSLYAFLLVGVFRKVWQWFLNKRMNVEG